MRGRARGAKAAARGAIAALLALLLAQLLATAAHAENTTYTNATSASTTAAGTTITVPAVNVTQRPNVYVSGRFVYRGVLEVSWMCNYPLSPSECPETNVTVVAGGREVAIVEFTAANASCGPGYCFDKARVVTNSSAAVLEVTYPGARYNVTVAAPSVLTGTPAGFIQTLLPFAVAAGAAARGDLRLAGLGSIAAAVVIYIGQELGLWSADPLIVTFSVIAGVVALWLSR